MPEKSPIKRELSQGLLNEQLGLLIDDLFMICQSVPEYRDAAGLVFPEGGRTVEFFLNNIRHTIVSKPFDDKFATHRVIFKIRRDTDLSEERISIAVNKRNPKFSTDNEIIYKKTKGREVLIDEKNTAEALSHGMIMLGEFSRRRIRPRI